MTRAATMALWQGRSKRKPTGGRLRPHRSKRKFEIGSEQQFTRIGSVRRKLSRTRGHNHKVRLLRAEHASVTDSRAGTTATSPIIEVVENSANPHYVRQNIITRGAIINTEAGRARVTSRPGQDGVVSAILLAD